MRLVLNMSTKEKSRQEEWEEDCIGQWNQANVAESIDTNGQDDAQW